MGGNAFNAIQPSATFPRMTPAVYEHAKARVRDALAPLYDHVATPHEAPEKADHGDIDIIVYSSTTTVSHDGLKEALRATWSIPKKGTSHFALPWDAIAGLHAHDPPTSRDHIQVDIHVCEDVAEFERIHFCHSYGDLAMILGLMARSHGLSFGTSGIRLAHPLPTSPPISFHLSSSFPQILVFFGLSMDRWKEGFVTQQEIFDWISSSHFYNPVVMARSETDTQGGRRARDARGMYQKFLAYASRRSPAAGAGVLSRTTTDRDTTVQSALQFFGKWELYSRILYSVDIKNHVNSLFTGKLVTEWTGVRGPPVRWIMDEVKKRLGGDEFDGPSDEIETNNVPPDAIEPVHWTVYAWQVKMRAMDDAAVRSLTTQVKEAMENAGRLEFDWREAKKRQADRKKAQE